MDFEIPEFLKDELLYQELSDKIEQVVGFTNYTGIPQLKNVPKDEFAQYIRGFIAYRYLCLDTDQERSYYLDFLKNDSVFNTIVPLLGEFCDIVIKSSLSDQAIKNQVAEAKIRYITLVKNCFKKEYKELSEKYDKMYYSESIKLIQNEVLEIEPEHLVSLAKCALIEEKTNPNGSLVKEGIIGDFANFEEVVIKVYYLLKKWILVCA